MKIKIPRGVRDPCQVTLEGNNYVLTVSPGGGRQIHLPQIIALVPINVSNASIELTSKFKSYAEACDAWTDGFEVLDTYRSLHLAVQVDKWFRGRRPAAEAQPIGPFSRR